MGPLCGPPWLGASGSPPQLGLGSRCWVDGLAWCGGAVSSVELWERGGLV